MPGFPSETIYADVIIVGTGPAGLLLATQLSRFPSISVKIIEKRSEKLVMGQADGIQCRTVEMFESFDFADQVLREAYWVNEVNFWGPTTSGDLHRTSRIQDSEEDLCKLGTCVSCLTLILSFSSGIPSRHSESSENS